VVEVLEQIMTDERLDEIKTKWNIPVTLPMAVPWGKDDVVWLVGEVTRLRAEARRADALLWQVEHEGCAASHVGETTYECRADAPCGLCRLRAERNRLRAALHDVMGACDAECAGCGAYYVAKKALDGEKEKP